MTNPKLPPFEPTQDQANLLDILTDAGARWTQFEEIKSHPLAVGVDGRPWSRRAVATIKESLAGRVISTTRGYRLMELSSRSMILRSHQELKEKAEATARSANEVITYWSAYVDGKIPLPPDEPGSTCEKHIDDSVADAELEQADFLSPR